MVVEIQNSQSSNSTDTNDINSPYHPLYFHPNDHPRLLLISKRLLGSENYNTWKRSILIALSAKNKLKLVNEDYEEPDSSSDLRAYWERANDILISWILNTVFEQIGNNLTFVNSASDLWKELYEHYSQLDGNRIYQLANEIPNTQTDRRNTLGKEFSVVTVRKKDTQRRNASSCLDPILSQSTPLESTPQSAPNEALVYARMNDLHNQLNQVLMMMQTIQSDILGTSMPHVAGP
ncbi:cysteine-rich receptor-like protein kinase 8 [Tanacetum coccineum]